MTALIKIGFIFFFVLALTFKRVHLWVSLLMGSVLLGLLFQMPPRDIATNLLVAYLDGKTFFVLGALFLILFFSNLLKTTGRMKEILEGFRHVFKDVRVVIALLPAIIGLMPLMGGALVSAPMVVQGSDELRLSPERRTFINYWFRHVWEYVIPTYPGFILATSLAGVSVRKFAWVNLPLTGVAIASGIMFGFWGVPRSEEHIPSNTRSDWRLVVNLSPLVVALVLVIGFKMELVYSFGLVILGMILFYRIRWHVVWQTLKESLAIGLLLTILMVMGFKQILESSKAIVVVSDTLSSSGIPLWLIAMLIPFLAGIMTGMTTAPVVISFPILIPLFQNDPKFLSYMSLSFVGVVAGDLLSPFHLCLLLTKDYFKADLGKVYRFLWVPVISLLVTGVLILFFR